MGIAEDRKKLAAKIVNKDGTVSVRPAVCFEVGSPESVGGTLHKLTISAYFTNTEIINHPDEIVKRFDPTSTIEYIKSCFVPSPGGYTDAELDAILAKTK